MVCKGNRSLVSATTIMIAAFTLLAFIPQDVHGAKDWGGNMWKIDSKRIYVGEKYGKWRIGIRARADGSPGDSIQMGTTKFVSNSISSTFGISRKLINASFKFDVCRSWSTNASKIYGLTGKKKGSWWAIQYKPVHKKYKVRARCYSFINGKWQRTSTTKWMYANRFDHFAYRLVRAKAPK